MVAVDQHELPAGEVKLRPGHDRLGGLRLFRRRGGCGSLLGGGGLFARRGDGADLDGRLGLLLADDGIGVEALGVQPRRGAPRIHVHAVPVDLLLTIGIESQQDQGKNAHNNSSDTVFHIVLPLG